MGKPPDILFRGIKQNIEEFYDVYYFGSDSEDRKQFHLQLLKMHYNSDMFTEPATMRLKLEKFLTNLHEFVATRYDY